MTGVEAQAEALTFVSLTPEDHQRYFKATRRLRPPEFVCVISIRAPARLRKHCWTLH
jgi:hypothetical protein